MRVELPDDVGVALIELARLDGIATEARVDQLVRDYLAEMAGPLRRAADALAHLGGVSVPDPAEPAVRRTTAAGDDGAGGRGATGDVPADSIGVEASPAPGQHECELCGKGFATAQGKGGHKSRAHRDDEPADAGEAPADDGRPPVDLGPPSRSERAAMARQFANTHCVDCDALDPVGGGLRCQSCMARVKTASRKAGR